MNLQKGFAPILIIIVAAIVGLSGGGGAVYYLSQHTQKPAPLSSAVAIPSNKPPLIEAKLPETTQSGTKVETKITFRNVTFNLPIANINSQSDTETGIKIKYGDNKTLLGTFFSKEILFTIKDTSLTGENLHKKLRYTSQLELALQKKVIEQLGGNSDQELITDLNPEGLRAFKKYFMNLTGYTFLILQQNPTIIYAKSSSGKYNMIFFEDSQKNLYQLITLENEEFIKQIVSSLKIN